MGEKNLLKELLKEDQEPFQLKDYILDRKCQLQKQSSSLLEPPAGARTTRSQRQRIIIQLSSRKPISKAQYFPINLCSSRRGACFLSNLHDSPDLRKSPLVKFPSPLLPANKSPYRGSGGSKSSPLFLHVPALTANMLLEAATRIQRKRRKNKPESKNSPGHGLFGSLIKRLTHRKRGSSPETAVRAGADGGKEEEIVKNTNETAVRAGAAGEEGSSTDDENSGITKSSVVGWPEQQQQQEEDNNNNVDINGLELRRSCCSTTSTGSSSTATTTSSSSSIRCRNGSAIDDEILNVLEREDTGGVVDLVDLLLCSSPVSPFLPSALYGQNPTPGHHRHCGSPVLSPSPSPAISSPAQLIFQDNDQAEEEDDEEEKEQNSPVSILDPPFEDDDQGREEEAAYDLESGYAFVQRAKQQLLHKLDRFEKLAELDPLELEQRMVEEEEVVEGVGEHEYEEEDEEEDGEKSETIDRRNMDGLVKEIVTKSCSFKELIQKPGIKRLLSDIITYEEEDEKEEVDQLNEQQVGSRRDQICYRSRDQEAAFSLALVKRVGKRLDSWKQVESNSIDTMVETDVKRERDRWKDHGGQIGDTVMEIELHMFSLLVEEFTREVLLG